MSESKSQSPPDNRGIAPTELPFVSVVMPVRNEAAFIGRSVGSVLAQDYPSERMEVLVADGLSQDATTEVLRSLQQTNSNLRVIENPGKIVATGLNATLRQARGEVIVRVDGHCEVASRLPCTRCSPCSKFCCRTRWPTAVLLAGT